MKIIRLYSFLISLVFLVQLNAFGQNKGIDSLVKLYKAETSDSIRISLLKKISIELSNYGSYKEAYEYYEVLISIEDSINKNKLQGLLSEARGKYESEKAEIELALLEKDAEISNLQLHKNKLFTYSIIGFLLIVVTLTILFLQILRIKSGHKISVLNQKNLRQQLNPKFIIETVNSIQNSLFKNDKSKTNQYLSKFSRLMRLLLDNSQFHQISLQNEIDMAELYISLQKLRFNLKLNYRLDIDKSIDLIEYKAPSFILMYYIQKLINGEDFNNKIINLKIWNKQNYIYSSFYVFNSTDNENLESISHTAQLQYKPKRKDYRKVQVYKSESLGKNIKIYQSEIKDKTNRVIGNITEVAFPFY